MVPKSREVKSCSRFVKQQ